MLARAADVVAPGAWPGRFLSEAQGGSCEEMDLLYTVAFRLTYTMSSGFLGARQARGPRRTDSDSADERSLTHLLIYVNT